MNAKSRDRDRGSRVKDVVAAGDRLILAVCAGLFLVFALLGLLSEGTINDDDVGRFLNTREALKHPLQFISLWNRPAFVIAYVLPAQLGYWAVELLTALIAALTCFLVYRTAQRRAMENAAVSIVMLALQPLFFMLSFSALVEPLAALLVAASMHALLSRRYVGSAVFAALIPLARLELSLLLAVWAILYFRHGHWRLIFILPVGLIGWNVAGALMTADPFFLYNQVFTGAQRIYDAYGFWHYPSTFIFIAGPVAFAFVVVGLLHALWRRRLDWVHFGFLTMLLAYILLSWKLSMGQAAGFLRHFTAISPLTALIALEGFNEWIRVERKPLITLSALIGVVVVTGVYLSRELSGGLVPQGPVEHWKLAIVSALALVALGHAFLPRLGWERRFVRMGLLGLVVLLNVAHLAITEKPIRLTLEQQVVKSTAAWYRAARLDDRVTLCNHGWFHFFAGTDHLSLERCPKLTKENLVAAPDGAVAVWEGHYAHRLHGDVPPDYFHLNRDWYIHRRFTGPDVTGFFAVALEKVAGPGSMSGAGLFRPGEFPWLGVRVDLGAGPQWRFAWENSGPVLLTGAHEEIDLTFVLEFERFIANFVDTRQYIAVMRERYGRSSGLELLDARLEPAGVWGRLRYTQGGYEHEAWISISTKQGTMLRARFLYQPGRRTDVADAIEDLMRSVDLAGFH